MDLILFFDTETTGLPKTWAAKMTQVDNWPRVAQLAWQLCDKSGNVVSEQQILIKPDKWTIPKEKFFIDNGMSTERCQEKGIPMANALLLFIVDLKKCTHMVAHNIAFDYPVLGAEFIRYGKKSGVKLAQICTMESSKQWCALPNFKKPKLIELYQKCFGKDFEGAHDAMNDVIACRECFFELLKLEIIKL